MTATTTERLGYLEMLEAEAIYILRETAGQFERPALLFSGGKDSIVLVRLAEKAFRPGPFPFPLVHIDTEYNFPEAIEFRDALVRRIDEELIVRSVGETIARRGLDEPSGPNASRNVLQIHTLLETIEEFGFDACIGGARRDEEKARAKERIFSIRDGFGRWEPRRQRPEIWNILNGRVQRGENVRVFPLSNWTELDVWNYIRNERIEVPGIYYAHERECLLRNGRLMALSPFVDATGGEIVRRRVRFRTVGDMTCTAAIESEADTVDKVIEELERSRISERGATRLDDQFSESAMEERKSQGYF
jgi:sulfate adenylyltransferase subunit 2